MSTFQEQDQERLVYQSLARCFGSNMIQVGQTALARAGWAKPSSTVEVAIPQSPSRPVPRIHNAVVYPVGAKTWSELISRSILMDLDRPPVLHPLPQMILFFGGTQIKMPDPACISWEKVRKEPAVAKAICQLEEEFEGMEDTLDPEHYYYNVFSNRFGGTFPGESFGEVAGLGSNWS